MLKRAITAKMRRKTMALVPNSMPAAYAVVLVSQEVFAIATVIFWTSAECAAETGFQKEPAIVTVTSQQSVTTATAIASRTQMATAYATTLRSVVARTTRLATSMQMRLLATTLAYMLMKVSTAMATVCRT
jgi:hypothetical protein